MPDTSIYECTAEFVADGNAKLSKFRSKKSGMTICVAEAEGPLVAGYLCVATEAHDDDGLPHTLEHLVFLGSEKFPYKGVLDLVANRCLAQGTNAWTDTDHTCYTVTTAGDKGFLNFLPIYVDHLLYPVLSEHGYVTEVHHINGEGEDAGIVYCEMQTRENSGESRCHLAMLNAMYPGDCGYKSETGGLVKNLRESTSNEKVRAYHKEFYRPENLCIIIVGQIQPADVFEALRPIEERIAKDPPRPNFVRPWQSPVPPLPESVTMTIEYPSDEDQFGLVIAAWRGPLANDYSQLISIQVLMDYLTDTSVSPLNQQLVEIADPLCNQVDYTLIENYETCIYLHFSNVPVEKLEEIKKEVFKMLNDIVDGKQKLDMERMHTVIRKKKLYILSSMENSPHEQLASSLIGDFLYGTTLDDLKHRVQEIPFIETLFDKSEEFWLNLLKKYIIDGNHVITMGKPSAELSDTMAAEESKRVEEQREKLGADGMKERANILKKAVENNEIAPPKELLYSVEVPSVKSIKFHPIQRICNVVETEDNGVDFCMDKMPCRFQVDVINTNFVRFNVLMNTSDLSKDLRMYLPLFVELFDESAIQRDGKIIPYQEVVKELEDSTIAISASLGLNYSRFFCGQHAQMIALELMVEEDKYEKSVQWVRELLYQIVFEPVRVKSTANKMITALGTLKRQGGSVTRTMLKSLIFQSESNHWAANMLRQSKFLEKVMEKLDSNPDEVVEMLNKVRKMVSQPENMTVHMAVNMDSLKEKVAPEQPWASEFLPKDIQPKPVNDDFKRCHELLQSFSKDDQSGLIIGLGSQDTVTLIQCAPCITSYTDPDYAALMVLTQYLCQLEGPLWCQIRGLGLAYSFSIYFDPNSGLIYFNLSKSTSPLKAYRETITTIDNHLSEKFEWDQSFFESATSSLVYEIIEKLKTVADVSFESLKAYYSNTNMNFTQELLEKIFQVTTKDLERVGVKYLKPLFDAQKSKCAICCHTNKVDDLIEGFKEFGRKLTRVQSMDDSFLTQY